MRFLGLNLTVPHKLPGLDLMDELDESARVWGAVNTVKFEARGEDGRWRGLADHPGGATGEIRCRGFNTDADAIVRSLREDLGVDPRGATILLLGAGGAGRTAALRLASETPAALHLVNRTRSKAEAVAEEIRRRYPRVAVEVGYPRAGVDLLLNATALGLKADDACPLDEARYPVGQRARAAGCRAANGLGMLLYQGAKALEIWTGQPAPVAVMREALKRNVYG